MKRKSPTNEAKTGTTATTNSVRKNRSSPPSAREGQVKDATQHDFYQTVADILRAARTNAYRAVNFAMVEAYWHVGRTIVEEEQRGEARAEYGAALLKNLSIRLAAELGTGFSEQSLRNMRQFYQCHSQFAPHCGPN